MASEDVVHILEALTAFCVALLPILSFIALQLGKRMPRPEEHALATQVVTSEQKAATTEAANERLKAKVDQLEARASQLPPAGATGEP